MNHDAAAVDRVAQLCCRQERKIRFVRGLQGQGERNSGRKLAEIVFPRIKSLPAQVCRAVETSWFMLPAACREYLLGMGESR